MDGDISKNAVMSYQVSEYTTKVLNKRVSDAQMNLTGSLNEVFRAQASLLSVPTGPGELWQSWQAYVVDSVQRSVLFWDTLRQRGDNFIEQLREGEPPVLHFDYEIILDAREFKQPVNYALARIVPPDGVEVFDERRPYIIIDPRAGQVPGIGGFKDDSQVGVALRGGHPVYFVLFFARPEPGQTLTDVTAAEQVFIKKVLELHPKSNKPVLVGNCQAGWAVMMLATLDPDEIGAILINGAPLSYWGGSWTEGKGNNVMRYAGGFLGGSWLASLAADMGNGLFDGASLVQNFENLNPSNTWWSKYRTVYKKVDTEPPRFLEFERWWGAFSLMNAEEIEWTVQNLFVGNDLWSGRVMSRDGVGFNLKSVNAPVVLFASLGDNITPPQQAFNWVADTYSSTEEIKARGQVIVGLLHESIGHLGIFVSGKVAQKEYTELVSVMKHIERLPPGLYGMEISDNKTAKKGASPYEVKFVEFRLEDVVKRMNRFNREDERPFVAVQLVSEFNQRAYELFAQPFVQSMASEPMARFTRLMNPARVDKWALSGKLNPVQAALSAVAETVRQERKPAASDNVFSQAEELFSNSVVAALDFYRDVRDALGEAWFFSTYSSPAAIRLVEQHGEKYFRKSGGLQIEEGLPEGAPVPEAAPYIKEALESIERGGFIEAFSRTIALLGARGELLSLQYLELGTEMVNKYHDLLPSLSDDDFRRIRGEQQIICRYAPQRAIYTLPKLLQNPDDRARYVQWLDILGTDPAITRHGPISPEQQAIVKEIRKILDLPAMTQKTRARTATASGSRKKPQA